VCWRGVGGNKQKNIAETLTFCDIIKIIMENMKKVLKRHGTMHLENIQTAYLTFISQNRH
jgi:hypothetical protein